MAAGFTKSGWWQSSKIPFIVTFPDASEPLAETGPGCTSLWYDEHWFSDGGGKPLFFTISSTDVSSIPWIGSLAERVVSNVQFSISKKQSKTRAANFRLNLAFCVLVLVSCLCCLCCRSVPLQREVLWELAVTSIQGFKSCCSETLERSSDNGYLRTQVWFPARHGSKPGLYETTVKISSALAFFFFSKCQGTLISAKHIKINSL